VRLDTKSEIAKINNRRFFKREFKRSKTSTDLSQPVDGKINNQF
jgi:hypothetical protein